MTCSSFVPALLAFLFGAFVSGVIVRAVSTRKPSPDRATGPVIESRPDEPRKKF